MFKKNYVLFLIFLSASSPIVAQAVIKGTVSDAETGEALSGTNVYLANTTIGTSTNKNGLYKVIIDQPGIYKLVFSFIGYEEKVLTIEIDSSTSRIINVNLQPAVIELGELSVTASNKKWKEQFDFFRKEFIGTSDYAKNTRIQNPEVLSFEINPKTEQLIAKASAPLIVINRALGYKIYIELVEFKWHLYKPKGFYLILPEFKPLGASSEESRKRWKQNRKEAFIGSFRHFLRSLYHDNLNSNHFETKPGGNLQAMNKTEKTFQLLGRVSSKFAEQLKGFELLYPVMVLHGNFDITRSVIASNTEKHTFFIDKIGNLLNPLAIIKSGYWKRTRLAKTLPENYIFEK